MTALNIQWYLHENCCSRATNISETSVFSQNILNKTHVYSIVCRSIFGKVNILYEDYK